MSYCTRCGTQIPDKEQYCPGCGRAVDVSTPPASVHLPPLPVNSLLDGRYVISQVNTRSSGNRYAASLSENGVLVVIEEKRAGGWKTVRLADNAGRGSTGPASSSSSTSQYFISRALPFKEQHALLGKLSRNGHKAYSDYFISGEREYLVREAPEGDKLAGWMSKSAFDESTAVEIVLQLCRIVGDIHNLGYLHFGIDPDNVYWTGAIASLYRFSNACPNNRILPYYMTSDFSAPELLLPGGAVIDARADIYSMGALLYWMLSGEKINIKGASLTRTLENIKSPQLARVIFSCLQADSLARPTSAAALHDQIQSCGSGYKSPLRFEAASRTDTGMVRSNNEDACLVMEYVRTTDGKQVSYGIYIVADGMGGHSAGEVASAMAVNGICSRIYSAVMSAAVDIDYPDLIRSAMDTVNAEIYQHSRSAPSLYSMGTTATVGLRVNSDYYLGHLGDSRCYLVNRGAIHQLTEDHSVVGGLLKRNIINAQQARIHPDHGKILRYLGNQTAMQVDGLEAAGPGKKIVLQEGDILVFCTDGLTDELSTDDLLKVIDGHSSADAICDKLIREANKRGGQDNSTVIVLKILAGQ